jgi:hypothetical protein
LRAWKRPRFAGVETAPDLRAWKRPQICERGTGPDLRAWKRPQICERGNGPRFASVEPAPILENEQKWWGLFVYGKYPTQIPTFMVPRLSRNLQFPKFPSNQSPQPGKKGGVFSYIEISPPFLLIPVLDRSDPTSKRPAAALFPFILMLRALLIL